MRGIITIALLVISINLNAQSKEELLLLKKKTMTHITKVKTYSLSDTSGSISGSLFIFYKMFFSSQDSKSCSFTPSCSVYSVKSMKKQGIFTGLLNTFDRLTRCHGLRAIDYPIDEHTHLLIDPVRDIHHEKL